MARLTLSIFSLTILVLTYTAISIDIVVPSCKETTHPAECTAMLMPKSMEVGDSKFKLAEVALNISINVNTELHKFIAVESVKLGISDREQEAFKTCVDVSRDVTDLLIKSAEEMAKLPTALPEHFIVLKNDIQTSVSSCLSYYTLCVDEFHEMEGGDEAIKTSVTTKMAEAERDTSIALALINQVNAILPSR